MTPDLLASVPQAVVEIGRRLGDRGFATYVVGGSLRDLLLGSAVHDWDLATSATPQDVIGAFRRVVTTGIKHGTVTVLHRGLKCEVTTLRGEGTYTDGRHPDQVVYVDDIRLDLARRDLTVNAMALDLATGELHDPFDGRGDLSARLLRAVGDAHRRYAEDGLRTMRTVRLAATLGFEVEAATLAAIPASLETFRKVSVERTRDELLRLLAAPRPSVGLRLMRETGLLPIVLPELSAAIGCAQGGDHCEDVFDHSASATDQCRRDPTLRLAALLHDAGKPAVATWSEERGHFLFPGHEQTSAALAETRLGALRLPRADIERVVALIRHHGVEYEPGWTDGQVRRLLATVGRDLIDDLLELRRADLAVLRTAAEHLARLDELRRRVLEQLRGGAPLGRADLAIKGREVMDLLGLGPGPEVGELLDALADRVIEDPSLNTPDRLRALLYDLRR